MSKLCMIYNTAPHYREAIFTAIDKEFDCDWYFGPTKSDIKEMDVSKLKNVHYYRVLGNQNKVYWQIGMLNNIFSNRYDAVFMLAAVRSLSLWVAVLLVKIFRPKKKLYIWSHGCYGREGKLMRRLNRWKNRTFDGLFLYNQYAKDLMVADGIPEERIHVIANSLDYHNQLIIRRRLTKSDIFQSHFNNNCKNIIFIGRLTKVKYLDLMLKALKSLQDCNFTLIGNGEEKENLKSLVNELGVADRVWFYGACYDEEENANLIYNADLCVAPGNVGLTAMHTMMFGTPVISHDDLPWQMPEFEAIQPDKTGAFFHRNDLKSLVDSIRQWFEGPGKDREAVRKNCYAEIDIKWNPDYQMNVIRKFLIF